MKEHNIPNVISGSESALPADSPAGALSEFYRAFNAGDMAVMERNWLQTPEASMSNPLGGIRRGWLDIRQVYEKIFFGSADVYVEYHDFTIQASDTMFCAVGRERGHFRQGDAEVALAIRTSRVYLRAGPGWKQLHHHGSIDDPGLLQRYQQAVRR